MNSSRNGTHPGETGTAPILMSKIGAGGRDAEEKRFRVHKKADPLEGYYIKIRYNGEYVPLAQPKSFQLPLSDFLKKINAFIDEPFDFNSHCGNVFP